jgi:hypothetical protein
MNVISSSGAVDVFSYSGGLWAHQAFVQPNVIDLTDYFGKSVAISHDGNTLAVGAIGEDSYSTGLSESPTDNSASYSGAAYLFERSGTSWSQYSYIKSTNTGANDKFGSSIALTGDSESLAVGAIGESSIAKGVNGDQSDNSAANAGAVYLY